jgi:hypothetical protein
MNEVLARLERIYRQQLEVYDEVLELAEAALCAAREGRPLQELDALVARTRRALGEIERLDALAAPDREWSREHGRSATETSQLRQPIAECARRLEQILDREREAERWILMRREGGEDLRAPSEAGD